MRRQRTPRPRTPPRRRRPSPTPTSGWPRRPASRRLDLSDMDLSNPAASGGGEGESLVGRNKAERGPHAARPQGVGHAAHRRGRPDPDAAPGRVRPRGRADRRGRSRRRAGGAGDLGTAGPGGRPGAGPGAGVRAVRAAGRARAGQAAGAQARQGPRRRPDPAHRLRCRRRGHPRRRRVGGRRRAPTTAGRSPSPTRAAPAPRRTTARSPRDPRAHQGRAQDDGAGDEPVGLHQPARHRVGHRRRDRHDAARRAAQGPARAARGPGQPAARALARGACWR